MTQKILIADDDEISIDTIIDILSSEGKNKQYIFIKALTTENACEEALKQLPDLIIMDYLMQDISSIDAINFFKNNPSIHNTPVILLTTPKKAIKLEKLLLSTSIDFITKPIDKIELITRVNSALNLANTLKELLIKNLLLSEKEKELFQISVEKRLMSKDLERLSIAASKSDNSVIIFTPIGKIEWVSEGFIKQYGYNLSMFKSLRGHFIFNTNGVSNIREYVEEAKRTMKGVTFHKHITDIDGNKKWLETTITPIIENGKIISLIAIEQNIEKYKKLESEHQKTEDLLENIMPHDTIEEIKQNGFATARHYKFSSVLYISFQNLNELYKKTERHDFVNELDVYHSEFDEITKKHNLEKIKSFGDIYLCAGGIPIRNKSNPIDVVLAALEIREFITRLNQFKTVVKLPVLNIKMGINSGDLVTGVIGKHHLSFDIWGDTVNDVKNFDKIGQVGDICIGQTTFEHIDQFVNCDIADQIIDNTNGLLIYKVISLKKEYALEKKPFLPNEKMLQILASL